MNKGTYISHGLSQAKGFNVRTLAGPLTQCNSCHLLTVNCLAVLFLHILLMIAYNCVRVIYSAFKIPDKFL